MFLETNKIMKSVLQALALLLMVAVTQAILEGSVGLTQG